MRELEACTKANVEVQVGREAAEAQEGAAKGKLWLEQQGRRGIVRKAPCLLLAELASELILVWYSGAKDRLA